MKKIYRYKDKEGQEITTTIIDGDLCDLIDQAEKDYTTSKQLIHDRLIHIWNWALRSYHMGVKDREIRAQLKAWQSNIAFGLIRSFIDVFISTLTEKPVAFAVKGITETGVQNSDNILKALATSADVTGFQEQSRIAMYEALKVGTFSFEIGMLPPAKKRTYTQILTNEEGKEYPKEVSFEDELGLFPYANYVPIFELFPDPSSDKPRYVTRRVVVSHKSFVKAFDELINSEANKSPLKHIVNLLALEANSNNADKDNYNIARDQVHREANQKFSQTDSRMFDEGGRYIDPANSQTIDQDYKKNLIEYKLYATDDTFVLHANNYPVYIGENPYGFIPFEILSATDPQYTLDCEGVPYKLAGLSDTMDSFMNNYIDSARSIASPTFVALKGAFLDQKDLENGQPGQVIYAETEAGASSLRRLEKGTVTDFNILDIITKLASQLTGISEYNLGISARERTATGALATTQSSLKRLSPFLVTFTVITSRIANKWLKLMKDFWTEEKFIAASGQDPSVPGTLLSNINLAGVVDISLQIDSMQAAIDEFGYKKLVEVLSQTRSTGLVNEDEVTRQIFKSMGFNPYRFVPTTAPQVTTPPLPGQFPEIKDQTEGQMLAQFSSPQSDLGNQGQGPQ